MDLYIFFRDKATSKQDPFECPLKAKTSITTTATAAKNSRVENLDMKID
jgi:hypothetical protein